MDRIIETISKQFPDFAPATVYLIVIVLGIFTAIYTAFVKFFFGKRLKKFEIELKSNLDMNLEKLRRDYAGELRIQEAQLAAQNQVLIQNLQAESNKTLKELEAEMNVKHDESQARLDYQYEARKRLYHECEPLIFQFVELSEDALYQIKSLARSTRQAKLPDLLNNNAYYIASTMYRLLAPMGVYKLIQRRLTIVDLTLDRKLDNHYQLAKHLSWSFTADFDLAWGLRVFPLDYNPNDPDWEKLRQSDSKTYWRQGLPIGRLDNAVESLLTRDTQADGHHRLISFGEFESELHKTGSRVCETFSFVRDIITRFHPEARPVLWRMLITQAHIYDSIVRFHKGDVTNPKLIVVPIPKEDRRPFFWRRDPNDIEQQQIDEPFSVAEAYLQRWLGKLFQN